MPPTPQRLHDLLLACGFDPAQLERITQQSMGTGLDAITQATDPAERARAIVEYATRYNLIRELTATVLTAGSDKPALQNVLLDDNMSLEDGKSTALDVVRLEHKVERLSDKVDGLTSVVSTLSATLNAVLQHREGAQPLNWNIIIVGIMVSIVAGAAVWLTVVAQ